ncbi:hypothetical protein [Anaerosporobacter sp.]
MDCKVTECLHNTDCKCINNNNTLNTPSKGMECLGFDYDCVVCQEIDFRHYECSDCCLSEDEYYEEEDC